MSRVSTQLIKSGAVALSLGCQSSAKMFAQSLWLVASGLFSYSIMRQANCSSADSVPTSESACSTLHNR